MNKENLHELINRYEEKMDLFYDSEHDELFKWQASKTWQEEWNKGAGSFAQRFNAARKDFYVLIDGSVMHPSDGILKRWEKEPDVVEELFRVLFQDAGGSVAVTQEYLEDFIEGMEKLRLKYFPGYYSYKIDMHTASVFLAMNNPQHHYIYRYSEASTMAKYIGFEEKIGSGQSFSLPTYYQLCDALVEALREHPGLLKKHFDCLKPQHYRDESLHLLVFDLMYCCRTYGLYKGLIPPETKKTAKKMKQMTPEEAAALDIQKKKLEILALSQELTELESKCDEYSELSLVGTQIFSDSFGEGTIVEQNDAPWVNVVRVRFVDGTERKLQIGTNIASRPHFVENDEVLAELFTDYVNAMVRVDTLRRKMKTLQNSIL